MSYDINEFYYDIAKREAAAVDKWMSEFGVTPDTISDYTLSVNHPRGGGTQYTLWRGRYKTGTKLGTLRVTYTAIDVQFSTLN